jgi:hypothetical protein
MSLLCVYIHFGIKHDKNDYGTSDEDYFDEEQSCKQQSKQK